MDGTGDTHDLAWGNMWNYIFLFISKSWNIPKYIIYSTDMFMLCIIRCIVRKIMLPKVQG